MKCPICNDGKIITNIDGTYECDNPECSIYDGTHTETFEALIHTRKALETIRLHLMTAKGRFDFYDEYLVSGIDSPHARFIKEEIDEALDQIKQITETKE